jgi:acetylornithine deacetylase/succinyl-diaminopimelate desuccinylase-like protein
MTFETFEDILAALSPIQNTIQDIGEVLLANLVMIGEIAAPTFGEQRRVEFLKDRFVESGLIDCSIDEMCNIYSILPGENGQRNILVVAHTDTVFSEEIDHTITVRPDSMIGHAIADNSLGVAAMTSLPTILEHLDIRLQSNLILMGAARSLGRGDLEGLRFFLSNTETPIAAGVSVEGLQLGQLSHSSIGMLRGEIHCTVPEEYDWTRFGATGAILPLNEIINQIVEIPVPKRPGTVIVLGSISGGTSFDKIATQAQFGFEIRSESAELVEKIRERIEEITMEVSERTSTQVNLDFFAKRVPGGIAFSHPLCRQTRKIIQALDIQPQISPSISELSTFIDRNIPAITIGITNGERLKNQKEIIQIQPIFTGLAQLVGVLLAIDGGFCDED